MNESPLPLYHKVYLLLKQRLEAEHYLTSASMPGENALAQEFGVSRLTIRRALDALQAEGLVERVQGRGTFATPRRTKAADQLSGSEIDTLMSHLADMGMHTKVRLVEVKIEKIYGVVAHRMNLAEGESVHRSLRIRSYDGLPFSYLTTYVPADIGQKITKRDLGSKPLLAIFKALGIQVSGAQQSISAVLADPQSAAALDVPIGSALLNIRRLVRDADGRPVEYLDALYRPDRYEHRSDMQAHDTPGSPTWLPTGRQQALTTTEQK